MYVCTNKNCKLKCFVRNNLYIYKLYNIIYIIIYIYIKPVRNLKFEVFLKIYRFKILNNLYNHLSFFNKITENILYLTFFVFSVVYR